MAPPNLRAAASAGATATIMDASVNRSAHFVLSAPRKDGGLPLLRALHSRHSTRDYSERPLPIQLLSDLLWAAFGVNRATGEQTVPYWRHVMVLDVYLAMADGVWLYEPAPHALSRFSTEDIRARTGTQDFVAAAPLNLIYVAHGERMADLPLDQRRLFASVDSAFIGQNVYLFCASEGLATVFRGAIDYPRLDQALRLPTGQFVTFAQTVGYPRP